MDYTQHIATIRKYNEIRSKMPNFMPDLLFDIGAGYELEAENIQYLAENYEVIGEDGKFKLKELQKNVRGKTITYHRVDKRFKEHYLIAKSKMRERFGRCSHNDIVNFMRTKRFTQREPFQDLAEIKAFVDKHDSR
jgi:hypothetical protein